VSSSNTNSRAHRIRRSGWFCLSEAGRPARQAVRFGLAAALSLVFASAAHADRSLAPSNGTWRRVSELSPAEKALIDWRSETPRSDEIPYLPAESYPFEAPFSAEEVGYRVMNFSHNARWPHTMADSLGSITKAGYLYQSTTVLRIGVFSEEEGVPGHIFTAPGKAFLRMFYYYTHPPKDEGMQGLWVYRRTDKEQKTKIDNFIYFPSLRRVRRLPQPRRDAPIQGAVQSVDDVVGRDAWEFSWRIVGADILHETARFPVTRSTLTLAHPDGAFYDVPTADIEMMGDVYPFYTEGGGVECYVLVGEPRKDWLPDYAASKLVYWVDQHYFYPLRIEAYDADGDLLSIQVRLAKQENPALGPEGYTNLLTVYWDANLDLITYSLHDAHKIVEWTEAEKKVMFGPDFMRRRWLKYRQRTHALVDSPKEFYLRPSLEPGKWPEERRIRLAPELEGRIRAQDAAGHLVFATSEKTQGNGDEPD
jgi:hypothetical protein